MDFVFFFQTLEQERKQSGGNYHDRSIMVQYLTIFANCSICRHKEICYND